MSDEKRQQEAHGPPPSSESFSAIASEPIQSVRDPIPERVAKPVRAEPIVGRAAPVVATLIAGFHVAHVRPAQDVGAVRKRMRAMTARVMLPRLATSRPSREEPAMVPYHVYSEAVKDREFIRGQITEFRYLVDGLIFTRGQSEATRGSKTDRVVRALVEIAIRRLNEIPSTSER